MSMIVTSSDQRSFLPNIEPLLELRKRRAIAGFHFSVKSVCRLADNGKFVPKTPIAAAGEREKCRLLTAHSRTFSLKYRLLTVNALRKHCLVTAHEFEITNG
jgi:hypothetical protein